jgi:hypothetical protein
VQAFVQAAEPDAARSQLVDDSEDMLCVPSEPIELPDGQDVAFAKVVEAGVKSGSVGGGAADAVVVEDADRPGVAKRVS